MIKNFDDILFVINTGVALGAAANPAIGLGLEAAARLVKIGHDAYVSGRERGEWTQVQAEHFDNVVLPAITSLPHWQKGPEPK